MNITTVPPELLPAFCVNPYAAAALKLTCIGFYTAIPPVRELFARVSETAWSNGFWVMSVHSCTYCNSIFRYTQHRGVVTDAGVKHNTICVGGMSDTVVTWDNVKYIWFIGNTGVNCSEDTGIRLVEDLKNIFTLSGVLRAGTNKVTKVVLGMVRARECVIIFEKPIEHIGIQYSRFMVRAVDAAAFAGCEYDCKVFHA